jgi:hypothetical protein
MSCEKQVFSAQNNKHSSKNPVRNLILIIDIVTRQVIYNNAKYSEMEVI